MAIGCKTILITRMLYAYHDKIVFWEYFKAAAFPYNQIRFRVIRHLSLLAIEFHDACLIASPQKFLKVERKHIQFVLEPYWIR